MYKGSKTWQVRVCTNLGVASTPAFFNATVTAYLSTSV